jgi:hypothetical protein
MDEPTLDLKIYNEIKSLNSETNIQTLINYCKQNANDVVNAIKKLSNENLHQKIVDFWNEVIAKLNEPNLYASFRKVIVEIVSGVIHQAIIAEDKEKISNILSFYNFSSNDMGHIKRDLIEKGCSFESLRQLNVVIYQNPSSLDNGRLLTFRELRSNIYAAILEKNEEYLSWTFENKKIKEITEAVVMIINGSVPGNQLSDDDRLRVLKEFLNNTTKLGKIFQNDQSSIKILLKCFDCDDYTFSDQDRIEIQQKMSDPDSLLGLICQKNATISQSINGMLQPAQTPEIEVCRIM